MPKLDNTDIVVLVTVGIIGVVCMLPYFGLIGADSKDDEFNKAKIMGMAEAQITMLYEKYGHWYSYEVETAEYKFWKEGNSFSLETKDYLAMGDLTGSYTVKW